MKEVKQEEIKTENSPEITKVEVSPEVIQEVQKEINEILQKHNVYLEISPVYNLIIKPRI